MEIPDRLLYTKSHEWAKRESKEVVVGISSHAQEELRDIVFVELPKIGRRVAQGEPTAVIESVKAAFDIYAPLSGTITRVNDALAKLPQIVNQDCYGNGWLFAIAPDTPAELASLMTAAAYAQQLQSKTH